VTRRILRKEKPDAQLWLAFFDTFFSFQLIPTFCAGTISKKEKSLLKKPDINTECYRLYRLAASKSYFFHAISRFLAESAIF
jgi:hypothetical protein